MQQTLEVCEPFAAPQPNKNKNCRQSACLWSFILQEAKLLLLLFQEGGKKKKKIKKDKVSTVSLQGLVTLTPVRQLPHFGCSQAADTHRWLHFSESGKVCP